MSTDIYRDRVPELKGKERQDARLLLTSRAKTLGAVHRSLKARGPNQELNREESEMAKALWRSGEWDIRQLAWIFNRSIRRMYLALERSVEADLEEASQWLPVIGFEDSYEISRSGKVRNKRTGRTIKPVSTERSGRRYRIVTLSAGGKRKAFTLHRLVYAHFNGPIGPREFIEFRDGDDSNVSASNLVKAGWWTNGMRSGKARRFLCLLSAQVFKSALEASKKLNIPVTNLYTSCLPKLPARYYLAEIDGANGLLAVSEWVLAELEAFDPNGDNGLCGLYEQAYVSLCRFSAAEAEEAASFALMGLEALYKTVTGERPPGELYWFYSNKQRADMLRGFINLMTIK